MSSHTDEEIRAAGNKIATSIVRGETLITVDDLLAELNKPAIHPDVPVILEWDNGQWYYTNAGDSTQPPGYKTIIAIPEETVRQMIIDIFHGYDKESHTLEEVLRDLKAEFADYRRNGPDAGDGRKGGE